MIAGRNINHLRCADDTSLTAESEEELKSLLMKVKEESGKVGLKLNLQKTKIMTSGPITSWQTDGKTVETATDFVFLGSKIIAGGDCSHEVKRLLLLGRKAREFQKNIYFCFTAYAEAFDCVGHNKLWNIPQETGIPDHLTCLLRHLYAGQEATVRTRHETMDWFQIGKGVCQGCILSPCLF